MPISTIITTLSLTAAFVVPAFAGDGFGAPEIGAEGSLPAITAVAAFAAMLWQRRRAK